MFSRLVKGWKKKWVPLANPNKSNSNNNSHSHLLRYKWTPITPLSHGAEAATPPTSNQDVTSVVVTPPSAAEESDDERKSEDASTSLQPAQGNDSDRNPEGSDALMEEAQVSKKEQTQSEDAKETNLDLRLGLRACDDDHVNDPKAAGKSVGLPEKFSSVDVTTIKSSANSESESRKRNSSSATNLEMRL
ncbi:uncharacterized protein LOC110035664 [Phalaenopsis equestris]|uniref:uncharacterized protein LOC110035664 n=1 Tax=Phalaenopsis equestris TaxID=78828 RepID=UPI0009E34A86|nr:uncharacterized protein LOC110035664 [Phalaenopsis equestris]